MTISCDHVAFPHHRRRNTMWDAQSFLNQYRGAHLPRRKEAVRAFRAMTLSLTELIELYRLLRGNGSKIAHLLMQLVRVRIKKKRRELSWQEWFAYSVEFGLSSWLGRCTLTHFFASLDFRTSFEVWYERWTYVTTRPARFAWHRDQPHFKAVSPILLKRLLAGLVKNAKTLKDWRRVYDAPEDFRRTNENPWCQIGADNIRREAWNKIKTFLP